MRVNLQEKTYKKIEDYRLKHPGTPITEIAKKLKVKPWRYYHEKSKLKIASEPKTRTVKKRLKKSSPQKLPSIPVPENNHEKPVIALIGNPDDITGMIKNMFK
jgi:hypothetical protein